MGSISRKAGVLAFVAVSTFAHAEEDVERGNREAQVLAERSPLVQSALRFLVRSAGRIREPELRKQTLALMQAREVCVRHRARLTPKDKADILATLVREGLVDSADEARHPGGLLAGVFPRLLDDGGDCPRPPQPFVAAAGSSKATEHHSYPGGLVVHEAFVQLGAAALGEGYRRLYVSSGFDGLPVMKLPPAAPSRDAVTLVDPDLLLATPVWHDWTKVFVCAWRPDGSAEPELHFGGNGRTDDHGRPGSSKAHAHHILGIAEVMSRGFRPDLVITLASSHAVPHPGNEFQAVNWIRTAGIIARVDPVLRGLLFRDVDGRLRIAPVRSPGNRSTPGSAAARSHLLAEYALHQLGDGDWTFTNAAAAEAEALLRQLAPENGFDPADAHRYRTAFRNPVLAYLTSERIAIIYGNRGLDGVRAELARLRKRAVF